jgi:hypothetical protein
MLWNLSSPEKYFIKFILSLVLLIAFLSAINMG